jgi:hypothetical protein
MALRSVRVTMQVGQVLVANNRGGETHTFTEVEEFGGGNNAFINNLVGLTTVAPGCEQAVPLAAGGVVQRKRKTRPGSRSTSAAFIPGCARWFTSKRNNPGGRACSVVALPARGARRRFTLRCPEVGTERFRLRVCRRILRHRMRDRRMAVGGGR